MKNITKTITLIALAVIVLTTAAFTYSPTQAASDFGRRGPRQGTGWRQAPQSGNLGIAPLSEEEKSGLKAAIVEEYTAMNTYLAISKEYDSLLFARIARSEQRHVDALIKAAARAGLEIPENPGSGAEKTWSSYAEACAFGVQFEKEDAALYDELMAKTSNAALTRIYTNLQRASLQNHLPAFEACNP